MSRQADQANSVEVRHSDIHGHGVFAKRVIAVGAYIGRYTGKRYTARQSASQDWDQALTYVFGLSDGSLINGGEGGNATRHLNHSCAPNCLAYEVKGDDGLLQVEIETARRIDKGEELFIDYALQAGDGTAADYACRCGAASCRGTMLERAAV